MTGELRGVNGSNIYFECYFICFCFLLIEVFRDGVWAQVKSIRDPELRELAKDLPAVVLQSRATSTVKKYQYAFLRWVRWARKAGCGTCPASGVHFALYLLHLSDKVGSKAGVESAVNAIAWAHELMGIKSVTEEPLVKSCLKGLRRKLAKPVVKKRPVTAEMLKEIAQSLGPGAPLSEVRLLAAAVLSFAGFLRYDELSNLRCCDVEFKKDHVSLHINSSKTDQFRKGAEVVIARTGSVVCPVSVLHRYFRVGSIDNKSELKLFRGVYRTKQGERLRASGGLSYTRLRELLLKKLEAMGYDKTQFSPHSLRAGGATAAANANVKDRLFKRHGRWRSESAKDGYVEDSLRKRLRVSQSLGL